MTPNKLLWKSGCVKRWHCNLDHHLRESGDTTGAHSQRMAMLLLMLHPLPSAHLLACVLTHDTQEIMTGDMPSPAKNGAVGKVMEDFERSVAESLGLPIPSDKDKKWVTLCDKLDAILWIGEYAPYLLATDRSVAEISLVMDIASELGVADKVMKFLG